MSVRGGMGYHAHRECPGVKRSTPLEEEGLMTNDDV